MPAPIPKASSLMRTTSMPMTSAAVSSWWIESIARPRLDRSSRAKKKISSTTTADDVFQRARVERDVAETLRAADVVPAQRDHLDDFGEAEREQQEIDALDAQRRKADDDADHAGDEPAERQRNGERQAEFLRQDRRGVGADRHEAGLAERDLAGLERRKEAVGGNQR